LKNVVKSRRAVIRGERREVRLAIRNEILNQRALRVEIEDKMARENAEMVRIREEANQLIHDFLESFKGKPGTWPECQTCDHWRVCKDVCLYDTYPQGTVEPNDWRKQYEREYYDFVDAMEEELEREWDDDVGDIPPDFEPFIDEWTEEIA
jgi:radical SAM protein with 4Fe4S-binding SPASM domain